MFDFIYLLVIIGIGVFLYIKTISSDTKVKEKQRPIDKAASAKTAQDFTLFEDIKDDMIIVDSHRYRAVLKLEPINFAMYSFDEQRSIKERFRAAMIGVRYPFSFYIPSLRNNPKRKIENITYITQKYNEQGLNNLAQYGDELARWVEWQTAARAPLQNGYYLVINYEEPVNSKYQENVIYQQAIRELDTRCKTFMSALARTDIKSRRLTTEELYNLMYFVFNRELTEIVDFKDIIQGGIFGLYTTEKAPLFNDGKKENLSAAR